MTHSAFLLKLPEQWHSSTVFSSPHSGRDYEAAFIDNSQLSAHDIRSSEDAYVDRLFEMAPDLGAPLISATAPRAYLDLNRGVDELDSAVIDGVPSTHNNPRIAAGLGIIPRVVSQGKVIQSGKMSLEEAQDRIDRFYHPYHEKLHSLLEKSLARFNETLLIDCHSMPRSALGNVTVRGGKRPDIVIGDRYGSSCAPEIVEQVERAFLREGFIVGRNMPFAGAYILRKYGRPALRCNAVQVEIDRSLYMCEESLTLRGDFEQTQQRFARVCHELTSISQAPLKYAAE